jgi:hypothetical protein
VTADEVSSEETSDDVEWLVRIEAPPARETLPNLRKLENFGDFVGNWAVELTLSTVGCLAGILGKVADAIANELVVDWLGKPADLGWIGTIEGSSDLEKKDSAFAV